MTAILYIAGPMTGLPDNNYPAFNRAEQQLRDAGYIVLNPVRSHQMDEAPRPVPAGWTDYMRNGLTQLVRADGIVLLPGWHRSQGACVESEVARQLGMTTGNVGEWLRLAAKAAS